MSVLIELVQAAVHFECSGLRRRCAFRDLSLRIRRGEWISVVGGNGSGKSTLAHVLLGLRPLSAGALRMREDISVYGVLQNPEAQLLGDTVGEEFALSRLAFSEKLLKATGLSLTAGTPVSSLSGGQKQLLNLAVALGKQPDALILDEPTAMLDPLAREDIVRIVRKMHRELGTAVLWITHRTEECVWGDRVIVMRDGRMAYEGTPRAFFYGKDPGLPPCLAFGMTLPYVIETGRLLREQGILSPDDTPLLPEELALALAGKKNAPSCT